MPRNTFSSPIVLARIFALFLLLTILGGIFAQGFVSDRLVDVANASATANNILTHQGLFQFGFTVFLVEMACQIVSAVFFYQLIKPVNRTVALVWFALEMTASIIKTFARVFYIAPLFVLAHPAALKGFSAEQLQSVVLILLKVNSLGAAAAVAFFGFTSLLGGYLIFRSKFLPRWLGVLSFIAGLGSITFLYPSLGYRAFPFFVISALLGAGATIFWLLVFGVNEEKWFEQARSETG
jgi:hypothetical protein